MNNQKSPSAPNDSLVELLKKFFPFIKYILINFKNMLFVLILVDIFGLFIYLSYEKVSLAESKFNVLPSFSYDYEEINSFDFIKIDNKFLFKTSYETLSKTDLVENVIIKLKIINQDDYLDNNQFKFDVSREASKITVVYNDQIQSDNKDVDGFTIIYDQSKLNNIYDATKFFTELSTELNKEVYKILNSVIIQTTRNKKNQLSRDLIDLETERKDIIEDINTDYYAKKMFYNDQLKIAERMNIKNPPFFSTSNDGDTIYNENVVFESLIPNFDMDTDGSFLLGYKAIKKKIENLENKQNTYYLTNAKYTDINSKIRANKNSTLIFERFEKSLSVSPLSNIEKFETHQFTSQNIIVYDERVNKYLFFTFIAFLSIITSITFLLIKFIKEEFNRDHL